MNEKERFLLFFNRLRERTESDSVFSFRLAHLQAVLSIPKTVPTRDVLWKAYLITVVSEEFSNVLFSNQRYGDYLVDQFLEFSDYAIERNFRSIIEDGPLCVLSSLNKESLVKRLFRFNAMIRSWIDGSFHQETVNHPLNSVKKLKEVYGFGSCWECARFLSKMGYSIPSSKRSSMIWSRWSGAIYEKNSFSEWWRLLGYIAEDSGERYKNDAYLDLYLGDPVRLSDSRFCHNREACRECPLKVDCSHLKQIQSAPVLETLENRIRNDESQKISSKDLIVYLCDHVWSNSEKQLDLIHQFPHLTEHALLEFDPGSDEERLCLFLLATQELAERAAVVEHPLTGKAFCSSLEIYRTFRYKLGKKHQESFFVLILDNKYRVIKHKMITVGILNQSLVHPREVFAPAIQLRAAAIILLHNHPSGDPKPSDQDVEVTKRLREVGDIIGIKVLDHLIIAKNSYFSFVDEDLI